MAKQTIGIIGAGNMGGAMAARLRGQAWPVVVRDIDARREREAAALGAAVAASPGQLAQQCATVIVAVVDATQTREVLFGGAGAAGALARGACVLLCPTIAPADVEDVAKRLAEAGVDCIDAPMSGGPARARDGSMSLMLAGDDALLARQTPLLETLAAHRFLIGRRVGDAARTKLVNNLLAAINLAGAAESLALAERLGLDPRRTLDVIERSSGQSWIGSDRLRRALAGDTAVHAHMALLNKDSHLALEMAIQAEAELVLGPRAAALFAQACADGRAQADDALMLEVLRAMQRHPG